MTNGTGPRHSHSNPLLSAFASDWRDRPLWVAGPDDGHERRPSGSRGWRWFIAEGPDQASTDWDQADDPYALKAPGWVRALTLIALSMLLWLMLLFAPLFLLTILVVSGFALYWTSRRWRGFDCYSPPREPVSVDAEGEELALGEPSTPDGDIIDDHSSSWMGLLFWVSIGGFVAWHLLGGAGS